MQRSLDTMEDAELWHECSEDDAAPGPSTTSTSYGPSVYELHRAAFYDDTKRLALLLQQMPPEQHRDLDLHGNTALHVAAMRGSCAALDLLLAAGIPAATRSSRGWTPFDEACAARAMTAARLLQARMLADAKAEMKEKRAQLLASMRELPDYSLQLEWQLGSSLPGLSMLLRRYAPHDTYTVWKVGDRLRVDGSLMGLDTSSNMIPEWKRGHFSLIVDGSPEGIAAAAAAAAEAAAAAAARGTGQKQQRTRRPPQQQQQAAAGDCTITPSLPVAAPATPTPTPTGAAAAITKPLPTGGASLSHTAAAAGGSSSAVDSDGDAEQQQFYDPEPPPAPPGGPRLLFLNHGKCSWVDLSADKKVLKLEMESESAELNSELVKSMERDIDKLRLKPRNFRFAPLKSWLGGDLTEKVEGWKCVVYEATGKLLAVSTSKAHLALAPTASFEDYLSAEYAADAVSEALLDPLSVQGMDALTSSSGKKKKGRGGGGGSNSSSSRHAEQQQQQQQWAGDDLMGSDADFKGMVWGDSQQQQQQRQPSSSSSSRKAPRQGGDGAAAPDGSSGAGRLLRARCWMAKDFPMRLSQLLPLLDVIGNANKHMAKVSKFLAKYSQLDAFPVKLQVPLVFTLFVLVSFKAFTRLLPGNASAPPPGEAFFAVPPSYSRKLLADVMEKAASRVGFNPGLDEDEDEEDESGSGEAGAGADEDEEGGYGFDVSLGEGELVRGAAARLGTRAAAEQEEQRQEQRRAGAGRAGSSGSSGARRPPPRVFYGGDIGDEYMAPASSR